MINFLTHLIFPLAHFYSLYYLCPFCTPFLHQTHTRLLISTKMHLKHISLPSSKLSYVTSRNEVHTALRWSWSWHSTECSLSVAFFTTMHCLILVLSLLFSLLAKTDYSSSQTSTMPSQMFNASLECMLLTWPYPTVVLFCRTLESTLSSGTNCMTFGHVSFIVISPPAPHPFLKWNAEIRGPWL